MLVVCLALTLLADTADDRLAHSVAAHWLALAADRSDVDPPATIDVNVFADGLELDGIAQHIIHTHARTHNTHCIHAHSHPPSPMRR